MSSGQGVSQPAEGDSEKYRLDRLKRKADELGIDDPNDPRVIEALEAELDSEAEIVEELNRSGVTNPHLND